MFIGVAGPAMLVAANLLNVLKHQGLTQEQIRETLEVAAGNPRTPLASVLGMR